MFKPAKLVQIILQRSNIVRNALDKYGFDEPCDSVQPSCVASASVLACPWLLCFQALIEAEDASPEFFCWIDNLKLRKFSSEKRIIFIITVTLE